ncbi:NADH-quinone oxidoreductase subunit N [Rubricella aquisinus]|uniref:NADH-quinone oxidoreductase subunit N n=1 Tax=Rubricella aquisinus TaxID=2028108 RepID=A0A840WKX2_9RHOB|nr:NADH-quinone oxidoreductase subunit NuoN [Rubricella aquisinus]MBB5515709.1 NADH-quinone oxidoreductase subunit N [Rubricella aquisinus]
MISADLNIILPELVLAIFAMAALMWGVFMGKDRQAEPLLFATSVVFVLTAAWVATLPGGERVAFNGAFIDDGFGRFAKVLLLLAAASMLLLSREYLKKFELMKFEFPVLITLAVIGMMMMVSAGDLMALYMGLELQSLALYVVAAFRRDSVRSTEAGLKYFVLGALSSGLLLYGASLVYGYTGTTNFAGISEVIAAEGVGLGLLFGLVFMCTGMAFKISAVPFHMWTPDVYEGSPTPVTAFFATAPKVAAAGLFARVLFEGFAGAVSDWQQILAFLAIGSMYLGSIAAIGQTNIKRLMAYSSIGHMGFALVGLAAGTEEGVQALLIYMAIYVTMNVGVFAFILNMERDGRPVTDIHALGLYSRVRPARALALAILMFSLAGIPPLVGFFGKYYVFLAAVSAGLVPLAVLGVIASVIGAYYYLRIIFLMYFGEEAEAMTGTMPVIHAAFLIVATVAMVLGAAPVINLFGVEAVAADAAAALLN